MRIVVTGGGTSGHVTPILAVAAELKRVKPEAKITFVRQIGDKFTKKVIEDSGDIDKVRSIAAGKFRRYHGVAWYKQAMDIPMQLLNLRDAVFFILGLIHSILSMIVRRPDVVFVKGGYVGLPVGLAASFLRIPLVIHESDTYMGLTNHVLSKHASAIGVGMPEENYQLEGREVSFVGVPVSKKFHQVRNKEKTELKASLGLDSNAKLTVVTGGSQGAEKINLAMAEIAGKLIESTVVIHQAGFVTLEETESAIDQKLGSDRAANYKLEAFINDMPSVLGAADVVVSRLGATTMAELAILAKPTILVPNPKLVYGHQLKNAQVYKKANAAIILNEDDVEAHPEKLLNAIGELLNSAETMKKLSTNLHEFAKPKAARDIAKLILSKS